MTERFGTISALPKGTAFTRLIRAVAQAGDGRRASPSTIAAQWRDTPEVEMVLRAGINELAIDMILRGAVSAGTTTDATWASALASYQHMVAEWAQLLRPMTIIGKLTGLRTVPFDVTYPKQTAGATMAWVGEGAPAPVSKLAFETATIGHAKAAGIIVLTKELVDSAKPAADVLLRTELLSAAAAFLDAQFISPSVVAVVNTSPASVTNGITAVQSTGSTATLIAADLSTMVSAMADADVPFSAPAWVMRNSDAAKLAAKRTTTGGVAFPDIHVRGGMLLGIPVVTSNSVPASVSGGSIVALLDASQIDVADENLIAVASSDQATLQMRDDPLTGEQSVVSMYQTNSIATRIVAYRNWKRRRDAAVAVLDNVFW